MEGLSPTLLIRHLPRELTDQEKIDLICHFGAQAVRPMGTGGPMKHSAFAKFPNPDSAANCLKRLHQLEVLGCKLVVEFANTQHEKYFPSDSSKFKQKENDSDDISKPTDVQPEKPAPEKVDNVFSKHGIQYPKKPTLKYMYPPPTVSTLTNIANALASHPRFYTQVLHLMNKMNLPCPFGPVTPSPPLALDQPRYVAHDKVVKKNMNYTAEHGDIDEVEMEYSSTEESEIETDSENKKEKNVSSDKVPGARKRVKRPRKRMKLIQPDMSMIRKPAIVQNPREVFEAATSFKPSQIQFNLSETDIINQLQKVSHEIEGVKQLRVEQDVVPNVQDGFGKVEPQTKPKDESEVQKPDVNYKIDKSIFLRKKQIVEGRLKQGQMKDFSVFKNYSPGDPTSRLYIKNLTKQTSEQDLVNLFGSFVDWSQELASEAFDVRVMKEGRMKGQAFITLPNEDEAKEIVKECNRYILNNKPIVIQFARSAKAKQVDKPMED